MAGKGSVLLPSSDKDFSRKEFWEKFFKNRGAKSFEWYGEYATLCSALHKYIKLKDRLLVVGCGNSSLGTDLYDTGHCRDITSIDNSAVAIRQMAKKYEKSRPEMKFVQMDATSMPEFTDSSFTCALDKATLDAIYSTEEQRETAEKMLFEVGRVLSVGGRYIIISLAQEHIVNFLCSVFTREGSSWLIRVLVVPQAPDSDLQLPVFTFVFTKCISNPRLPRIIEVQNPGAEKFTRLNDVEELSAWVLELQEAAIVCQSITSEKEGRVTFQNDVGQTTYTCFVLQSRKPSRLPFAVFVVPFGQHSEAAFSTASARRDILSAVNAERLMLVMLHPNVYYESQEAVKASLSRVVMRYAPRTADKALRETDVQILSSGDIYPSRLLSVEDAGLQVEEITDWGRRLIVPGRSPLSGVTADRVSGHVDVWRTAVKPKRVLTAGSSPIFLQGEIHVWAMTEKDKTMFETMRQSVMKSKDDVKIVSDVNTIGPFDFIIWRGGETPEQLRHQLTKMGVLMVLGDEAPTTWDQPAATYQVVEPGIDVQTKLSIWTDDSDSLFKCLKAIEASGDTEQDGILKEIRKHVHKK